MTGLLKFLSPLAHPVGFGWLILIGAGIACWLRKRRLGAFTSLGAAVLLWLICQPALINPLLATRERPYCDFGVAEAPSADAIIVLGGGWRESLHDLQGLDLTQAGDRLLAGIELLRAGKAPFLVVGGDPPRRSGSPPPDSDRLKGLLADLGLNQGEVLTLGPVISTNEEARRTRALMEARSWNKVLLVTSALHMKRALRTFQRAGVEAHPVACDFQIVRFESDINPWQAFPEMEAFSNFTLWWHEVLGELVYRLLGKA